MKFAILIGTKNRIEELKVTLDKCSKIINREDVEVIIVDDGSDDGTFDFIRLNFEKIRIFRNEVSKGILSVRNLLFKSTTAEFAISIDDDIHLLNNDSLDIIEQFFNKNPSCAVITFRVFWSTNDPKTIEHCDEIKQVNSFGAGVNAFRMRAKMGLPDFPDWFLFYGEEDFASYYLFKQGWSIYYVPDILAHHRVNIKERKKQSDYIRRTRLALRAGWYLILMFYPLRVIPKVMFYSIYVQVINKTLKGDFRATLGIIMAILDVLFNIKRIIQNQSRLTMLQYLDYNKIPKVPLYWSDEKNQ